MKLFSDSKYFWSGDRSLVVSPDGRFAVTGGYGEAFLTDLSPLDTTALPTPQELQRQAEVLSGMRLFENGVPVTLTRDEWLQRVNLD